MMEFRRKPGFFGAVRQLLADTILYEPVAYDKRIEIDDDGLYQPVVRMDSEELILPRQLFLHKAQQMLDLFSPDVWEGKDVPQSINYFPDARCMNA
jgi:hypothetical protein